MFLPRRASWERHRKCLFVALIVFFSLPLFAAETNDHFFAKLKPIPPCAALAAFARSNHWSITGIDAPADSTNLNPGDSLTALVTLHEKGDRHTQWLIHLVADAPDKTKPPAKPESPLVLYDWLGAKMEFLPRPAPVTVHTIGPFVSKTDAKPPKVHDHTSQLTLNEGFLALGLDQAAAALYRLHQVDLANHHGNIWIGEKAATEEQIKKGKELNKFLKMTPEEERAMAGAMPAMFSFFEVVQETEGLSDILLKIIRRPSIWSMIKNAGVDVDFEFAGKHLGPVEIKDWGLPDGTRIYASPMKLMINKQDGCDITLLATGARPPLLPCAGVVGLLAEKPGDDESYMTIRVISAHRK